MHKQTKGCILLLLCAMIWGAAFVAQSEGMQYVGPFTMGATRFFLAGLVLLPGLVLQELLVLPGLLQCRIQRLLLRLLHMLYH